MSNSLLFGIEIDRDRLDGHYIYAVWVDREPGFAAQFFVPRLLWMRLCD